MAFRSWLLVVTLLAGVSSAADWPEFRGPGQAAVLGLFSWVARGLDEAGIAEEPAAGFGGRILGGARSLLGRIRG